MGIGRKCAGFSHNTAFPACKTGFPNLGYDAFPGVATGCGRIFTQNSPPMALLESPHWETITQIMQELLAWIDNQKFATRFYLAGGTALALRMGHRRSVDLDFFSKIDEVQTGKPARN
jgi:hypothetical protein